MNWILFFSGITTSKIVIPHIKDDWYWSMQWFPGKYHSLKIFSYGCTHFHTLFYSCLLDVCVHFPSLYVVECWLLHFTAVDLDADSTLCHILPVPKNYQAFYSAADRWSISKIQDDSPKIQYEFRAKLQSHSPNVGRKGSMHSIVSQGRISRAKPNTMFASSI